MLRTRTRTVAATLTAATLVLAGCSRENDREPQEPAAALVVPDLELVWETTSDDRPFHDIDEGRGDAMWPADDVLGVVGKQSVTTYDVANGDATARIDLPNPVCAVSPDVNRDGVGAVLTGALGEDGVHVAACNTVVAIDAVAGRILWSREVAEVAYANNISVGAGTVAVSDVAAGARRLRIEDGTPLPTLGTADSSSNGSVVVATEGRDDVLVVYEQDSGKPLRRVAVGDVSDVGVVLPGDPTLVSVDERRGGFHFRDVSSARARAVGRELSRSYPQFWRAVQLDGTTVLQYGGSPAVDRWDPATRTLVNLTALDPTESLIGVHDGRLITHAGYGNSLASIGLLRSIDPDDPRDPLILGSYDKATGVVGLGGTIEVIGDLLVGQTDAGLVALRLPSDGIATSELVGRPDEVSAQQVSDLCAGLRPAALAQLGYRSTAGAPAKCTYVQTRTASRQDVQSMNLTISAAAVMAGTAPNQPAIEHAEASFAKNVAGDPDLDQPALVPVPDLGDEAAISAEARILVVRVANAIIRLDLRFGPKQATDRRTALIEIAGELVAELGQRRAAAAGPTR